MNRVLCVTCLAISFAQPLSAQESGSSSLMERGVQQFLENLFKEMEPDWRDMQGFLEEMGPAMMALKDEVKDWSVYELPEILENGDIIIRRKPETDKKSEPIPVPEPLPQIEL